MVEGVSLRAISRLTDTGKNTLARLLSEFGSVCAAYHNRTVRNVRVRRLQCDEVWTFIGAKAKNTSPEKKAAGWGDTWTWTAIDADSKLCVSYFVGGRDLGWAKEFMEDCASRIRGRVQVTTDGHRAYLEAVESAFGMDVDYAQLQKIYGAPSDEEARRYSPARCIGTDMKVVSGNPDPNTSVPVTSNGRTFRCEWGCVDSLGSQTDFQRKSTIILLLWRSTSCITIFAAFTKVLESLQRWRRA